MAELTLVSWLGIETVPLVFSVTSTIIMTQGHKEQ